MQNARKGRTGRPKPCGCEWLRHAQTGVRISIIRWCAKHKPAMQSMSGRPVEQKR